MTALTGATSALIRRLQTGDLAARDAIVGHTCERLRRLTRKMLRGYPAVRRWQETDDILQNALVRLCRALDAEPPDSARHFYKLAALQIRRELLDLANHFRGPRGLAHNHLCDNASRILSGEADRNGEPCSLAAWTEFHDAVEKLPEDEREILGLLWYDGLTQPEAADLLGVSLRTVKRRWQQARLSLAAVFQNEPPV